MALAFSAIELLEPRIAPAALVQITDIDGDTVLIKTSKGTNAQLTAALKLSGMGLTGTIREIDFSTVPLVNGANPFSGTDLTISVIAQGATGNGRVNVGYIDAAPTDGGGMDGVGIPLGRVKIAGDLGQIDVGLGTDIVVLKSLTVQSMGAWGTGTQGANGSGTSDLLGKVGLIKAAGSISSSSFAFSKSVASFAVAGSFLDSSFTGTGDLLKVKIGAGAQNSSFAANSIGTFEVKGTLHANMTVAKDIASLKIAGDFITGRILAVNMPSVVITGSIYGVDGTAESGSVVATGNIGKIKVGGDLRGGNATNSGRISAAGNIGSVTIDGSILGPTTGDDDMPTTFIPSSASTVYAGGNITSVKVGGNLAGPTLPFVQNNFVRVAVGCSTIIAAGDIGSVTILGSMIGVKGNEFGTSGNVRIAATHLGTITIGGDVTGTGPGNDLPEIQAIGSTNRLAIAKLTIGGSLRLATVSAGGIGGPSNADGQIGSVIIRGNLASATVATLDAGPGISDNVNVTSRIASLVIGGNITGNSVVRAEHIVSVTIGGVALKLQAGDRNDTSAFVFPPGSGSVAEYM